MKKLLKILTYSVLALTMSITSCKKKGCMEEEAKNYDSEAKKDDESCEYYTNTELLTMNVWKYETLDAAADSIETMYNTFLQDATFTYSTDGTVIFKMPADNSTENRTWEFNSAETEILIDKGLDKEETFEIVGLDQASFSFKFKEEDTNTDITIYTKP